MTSHDAEPLKSEAANPVRAAYESPDIEVVETVDGVVATAPGPSPGMS